MLLLSVFLFIFYLYIKNKCINLMQIAKTENSK